MPSWASDLALPEQISGLFDPTRIGLIATFDLNIGWGGEIWSQGDRALYLGVGARYMQGAAYFDLRAEGGELEGFSSLSPGLIFELDSTLSPSALTGDRYKQRACSEAARRTVTERFNVPKMVDGLEGAIRHAHARAQSPE